MGERDSQAESDWTPTPRDLTAGFGNRTVTISYGQIFSYLNLM